MCDAYKKFKVQFYQVVEMAKCNFCVKLFWGIVFPADNCCTGLCYDNALMGNIEKFFVKYVNLNAILKWLA